MLPSKYVVIFFLFISYFAQMPKAFAQAASMQQSQVQQISVEEQNIYFLTFESCRNFATDRSPKNIIESGLNPQAIDVIKSTYGDIDLAVQNYLDGETDAFREIQIHKGLGTYLSKLLESRSFQMALIDCFPKSEFKRKAYVADLLMVDATAKFLSVAPGIIGYFRILKWAKLYFHKPWVKILFLGHASLIMGPSSQNTKKSFSEMMSDSFDSLNLQLEKLLQENKMKNAPDIH